MSKSARAVIALNLISGVSLAVIVGWVTGFFASIASTVAGLWNNSWDGSTRRWGGGWERLLAGAGVLIVPAIVHVLTFAIADG